MTDLPEDLESLADIESLVRSAGDYVRPSEDLRPRVLEGARCVSKERQARRWIGHLAMCALALAMLIAAVRHAPDLWHEPAAARSGYGSLWNVSPATAGSSDASWSMVDSFTDLRRRQAELLRPAL